MPIRVQWKSVAGTIGNILLSAVVLSLFIGMLMSFSNPVARIMICSLFTSALVYVGYRWWPTSSAHAFRIKMKAFTAKWWKRTPIWVKVWVVVSLGLATLVSRVKFGFSAVAWPDWHSTPLWWSVAGVCILLLVIMVTRRVNQKRKNSPTSGAETKPKRTPHPEGWNKFFLALEALAWMVVGLGTIVWALAVLLGKCPPHWPVVTAYVALVLLKVIRSVWFNYTTSLEPNVSIGLVRPALAVGLVFWLGNLVMKYVTHPVNFKTHMFPAKWLYSTTQTWHVLFGALGIIAVIIAIGFLTNRD